MHGKTMLQSLNHVWAGTSRTESSGSTSTASIGAPQHQSPPTQHVKVWLCVYAHCVSEALAKPSMAHNGEHNRPWRLR